MNMRSEAAPRRLLVLPPVFLGLAGCVAVSGQPAPRPATTTIVAPAPAAPTAVNRARPDRADPGTGLCSGGCAALKTFATMV